MKVAVSVRVRNGHLAEAARQFKTQTAFAEWLEVPAHILSEWLNYSRPFWCKSEKYNPDIVAAKLELICGAPIQEIFPEEVYANKAWLKHSKVAERIADLPVEQLLATGAVTALPPAPDDAVMMGELREQIAAALKTLTPRQETVIRRRFGLDGEPPATLEEIGRDLGVNRERIRQTEAKAMRVLRHPRCSRQLRRFLEA